MPIYPTLINPDVTPAPATSTRYGPAYFDHLFASTDDPWAYETRWYEIRKRALTLASLPARRFARGFEPGCANGLLTHELAFRCDKLLAADLCERAVALARRRFIGVGHVEVQQLAVPDYWPAGTFDLIVLSEFGYYLDTTAIDTLAERARDSLRPGGVVVGCHWRHPIDGCALDGAAVQRRLHRGLALPRLSTIDDADFRLDVWSADDRSPARRDGLV